MAQASKVYASASVRVIEKDLLRREQLDRLVAAPTADDALRLLGEFGYGAEAEAGDEAADNESDDGADDEADGE